MKKTLLFFFLGHCLLSNSQSAADAAVQLNATAQTSPAQIVLSWPGNATTTQYQVFRKLKTSNSWGTALSTLGGGVTSYTDNTVSPGVNYEYRLIRQGSGYSGYGYINTGIEVPAIEYRGKLILLVDSTFISALDPELERLVKDIEGDGWEVIRHDVLSNGTVTHVKDLIINDYYSDPVNTKAVFIVGHVPVPYSGNINPDGHTDHLGAWPADCYYGDVDGVWTDAFVTSSSASSPARIQNAPGDGKFDQSLVPGDVELQVGRVDFNDLPAFSLNAQQLLKNYLDKDHDYRKKIWSPLQQAVIDDNFGYFGGEAFAASGWKNLSPLVGNGNITSGDYFTLMSANSYKWSYGCGGGSYTSASGVGNTGNFASANLQGVFTMLFGSYFGDWDAQNSFLKAALAQGKVLTNVWSGRPHFQFHHMGLGENIGYGLWLTQNNPGALYYSGPTGISGKWVHLALLGDPTLRNDVVAPVSNVVATKAGYHCQITWSASTETNIAGYNIYMKNDSSATFVRVNSSPVNSTSYTDSCLLNKGTYTYLVRALKLENAPSGSYYNLSEGIADTAYNSNDFSSLASFTYAINANTVQFTNTSSIPAAYLWDFGNGTGTSSNPSVSYLVNGTYIIYLYATHECYADTDMAVIGIVEAGLDERIAGEPFRIFPNPVETSFQLDCGNCAFLDIRILNSWGAVVYERTISKGETINTEGLTKGQYIVVARSGERIFHKKLVLK